MSNSNFRGIFVSFYRQLVYLILCFIFVQVFSFTYNFMSGFNRTSIVIVSTFVVASILLSKIYGRLEIGIKKNRAIFHSLTLTILITDIITFMSFVIMSFNVHHSFLKDISSLIIIFIVQLFALKLLISLGNHLYFINYTPGRSVIINNESFYIDKITKYLDHHKKQYQLVEILDSPSFSEIDINKYDHFFLLDMDETFTFELVSNCYMMQKEIMTNYSYYDIIQDNKSTFIIDDLLMNVYRPLKINPMQSIIKRLIDIAGSTIALILFSPFLFGAALAIKIEDKGPIFFKQKRLTRDGRTFEIYKLRSMKLHASDKPAEKDDDRITKVGKVIRRLRIDETPQLINILKGDMSLVGPRAFSKVELEEIVETLPQFALRLNVKAGLTGYAQIFGKYNTDPKSKLIFDLKYIENFSIINDIKLMLQTPIVLLKKDSTEAYDK